MDFLFSFYPNQNQVTGEKLTSIDVDLNEIQNVINHPVHASEKDTLSVSTLIPFCWAGKDTNIGEKIGGFTIPFCKGFKPKVRNDQVCFEFNPEGIIKKEDVKYGLHFIVDDNQDRMRFGSNYSIENNHEDGKIQFNKDDEFDGIKVHLDAIG